MPFPENRNIGPVVPDNCSVSPAEKEQKIEQLNSSPMFFKIMKGRPTGSKDKTKKVKYIKTGTALKNISYAAEDVLYVAKAWI